MSATFAFSWKICVMAGKAFARCIIFHHRTWMWSKNSLPCLLSGSSWQWWKQLQDEGLKLLPIVASTERFRMQRTLGAEQSPRRCGQLVIQSTWLRTDDGGRGLAMLWSIAAVVFLSFPLRYRASECFSYGFLIHLFMAEGVHMPAWLRAACHIMAHHPNSPLLSDLGRCNI